MRFGIQAAVKTKFSEAKFSEKSRKKLDFHGFKFHTLDLKVGGGRGGGFWRAPFFPIGFPTVLAMASETGSHSAQVSL